MDLGTSYFYPRVEFNQSILKKKELFNALKVQFHQERQTREPKKLDLNPLRLEVLLPHPGLPHLCSSPEQEGGVGQPLALGGITGHSSLHCLDLPESCSWPEALDT